MWVFDSKVETDERELAEAKFKGLKMIREPMHMSTVRKSAIFTGGSSYDILNIYKMKHLNRLITYNNI